jgi:hypothetical protein
MLMQMLHRGGMPCVGDWPAFEPEEAKAPTPEFIAASAGKAVKILDPQRVGLPGNVRVVWLDRDHAQQAKSHAKFLGVMMGLHVDRDGRRKLAASMVRDTHAALALIGSRPVIRLRFEDALAEPRGTALLLGEFARHPGFDVDAAAAAVRKRSPACAPGLDMELSLMEAA